MKCQKLTTNEEFEYLRSLLKELQKEGKKIVDDFADINEIDFGDKDCFAIDDKIYILPKPELPPIFRFKNGKETVFCLEPKESEKE